MARPPRYAPALPLPVRPYRLGSGATRSRWRSPVAASSAIPARRQWSDASQLDTRRVLCFRYGVDLFNAGCWWEAHEVWESLWAKSRRGSPLACLLQGLILLAAAQLQAEAGHPQGHARLLRKAGERLRTAERQGTTTLPLGLPLGATLDALVAPAPGPGATSAAAVWHRAPTLWLDDPP